MTWLERWRGLYWDPPGPWDGGFILLGIALVAFAVFVYRRNEAPLGRGYRALLITLRALALLTLVVILGRPVLSLALPGGAARGVLVLLDRSESLELPGRTPETTRDDGLRAALASVQAEIGEQYPLILRGFDTALRPPEDPAALSPVDGDGTDLAAALERGLVEGGEDGRPGALILISDGAQTQGRDPVAVARRLGVPVETLALGSSEPVPDLSLARVRLNREAFAGERTPLEVAVRLQGLENRSVKVQLFDVTQGEAELASETVTAEAGGAERRVTLSFTPTQPGLRFLEVRLPQLEGEATSGNNRRLVAIEVQEEKAGVALLSGSLTWDHTFLRRSLEADSTLDVVSAYRRGGEFRPLPGRRERPRISAAGLDGVRVVVLDHLTSAQLDRPSQDALAKFVRGGGGLLLVTGSRTGSLTTWTGGPLADLLPVTPGVVGGSTEVQVRLSPEGRRHTLFDPSLPGSPPLEAWTDLPPVEISPDLGSAKGTAEPLMIAGGGSNAPVVSWARAGRGRVLMVAAGGLWRWDFASTSQGASGRLMPGWWRRAVRWLSRPDLETRLDIHPEDFVVARGRPVTFVARVTDDSYQPVPNVDVEVEIIPDPTSQRDPERIRLSGANGFFSGLLEGLPPGRYQYKGTARAEANVLGALEGSFAVDSLGSELERLEADHEILERIAAASNGHFWMSDFLDALGERLQTLSDAEEERVQFALWDHPLLFAFFVVVASLEWLLRRRRGLV